MLEATLPDLLDEPVANPDAFYPDFNVKDWQEAYRVPGTAPVTLAFQLRLALRACNRALEPWKEEQILAGVVELPAELADWYADAVYARATALLIPLLPSLVTDERARDHIELLRQRPESFVSRSEAMLSRIRGLAPQSERIELI
jgi:Phage head completion protein (GPL)